MEKTLDYYLNLPYTIELQRDPEEGWFVCVKELRGCMSQGDTAEEAIDMIQEAMALWLEVALEDGLPIPEPRLEEDYSGKFVVRVPRSLHRELVENASRQGVSLNHYINVALARATGQTAALSPAPAEEPGWPGLKTAVRQVLTAAGFARDAGELDERLFASWLEGVFRQVESAVQGGYLRDALSYLEELALRLKLSGDKNPVLATFSQAISLLCQQIQETTKLQQGVVNDLMMRSRISQVVQGTNRPLAERVVQEERVVYSETSTERTSPPRFLEEWSVKPSRR
jgi:antitoxin HicB